MLSFEGIRLYHGERAVLDGVSAQVQPRDRVGLVGPNGAGKSTLLLVLAGGLPVDGGTVSVPRGARVGYLPQTAITHGGRSVLAEVLDAAIDLRRLGEEVDTLLHRLDGLDPASPEHEEILHTWEHKESHYRQLGGYTLEARGSRILRGLGFEPEEQTRACETFSGGWQMRIALARLLLQAPEYLLLDEPTNHLDIEARTWLEGFLLRYAGAVVLVSHDRFFLDRVIGKVLELRRGHLEEYVGNYSRYRQLAAEARERHESAVAHQQRELARQERFIERFRYKASKASAVQSRIRQIDKVERLESWDSDRTIRFRFPEPPRSGDRVLSATGLAMGYGGRPVWRGVSFDVFRGDKVAVVGVNGSGKSTLLRVLAGRELPEAGSRALGHNTQLAFFAQDQVDELPPDVSVLDALAAVAPFQDPARLRTLLGAFLFTGDEVHKPCGVLSGGERNRLALARVIALNANLLLLDEPTNHLDIESKEVLQEAVSAFSGSILFVSHDRAFTAAVATKVLEVRGGGATLYLEGYEDFLWRKAREAGYTAARVPGMAAPDIGLLAGWVAEDDGEGPTPRSAAAPPPVRPSEKPSRTPAPRRPTASPPPPATPERRSVHAAPAATPARAGPPPAPGAESHVERKKRQRQQERIARRVGEVTASIAAREAELQAADERLGAPEVATHYERLREAQAARDALQAQVTALYWEWDALETEAAESAGEVDGRG